MTSLSSPDGLRLFLHDWSFPDAQAVVAIVHGFGEHGGRYAHVAEAFRARGLASLAIDLRGHGRSAGPRADVRRFEDYHQDVDLLLQGARRAVPDRPVFLLGHSMGGLVVLDRLRAGPAEPVDGALISSPLLGMKRKVPPLLRSMLGLLQTFAPRFPLPAGIDAEHVCGDPVFQREYETDPLILHRTTPRWVLQALRAMERVQAWVPPARPPLLILYATEDEVVDSAATRRFLEHAGRVDASQGLPGYHHEILNESPRARQDVIDRMGDWMRERWTRTSEAPD